MTAMDKNQIRLLIFIVAYNAEKTIEKVLSRIPQSVFEYDYKILVIDDESHDETYLRTSRYRAEHPELNLTVLYNPCNLGYGGNQKLGYQYAAKHNFDIVVLLHGDGQYAPEVMEELIHPIAEDCADMVMGTRMAESGRALEGGMPLYKYVGNRILTCMQNALLGTELSEFHSGYRAYAVTALQSVPYPHNTDDFHFDTEVIIQFWTKGLRIKEVPIPTYYGDEICYVNGMSYAWQVLKASLLARLQTLQILYCRQYDIDRSEDPYPPKLGYASSHSLAVAAVPAKAVVLDIGCGQGHVSAALKQKGCQVKGIEASKATDEPTGTDVIRLDLSCRRLPVRAEEFDYILLLDVLEHLDLSNIHSLLDDIRETAGEGRPELIITTPNVAFSIVRLQLLLGAFNYGKRGILDMTHRHLFTFRSLRRVLQQSGYVVHCIKGVPAPFPAGFGDSLLSHAMLRMNQLLIRILPGIFSYQIFVSARPSPTLSQLLTAAGRRRPADR